MTEKNFDLESVYDAEIAPLMTQIIEICHTRKLPMFATFLYKNDEEDTASCTTNLMFKEREIPQELLDLEPSVRPRRRQAMQMTVTKADGSKEITMIL